MQDEGVIVIGGGVGGLVSAALLAARGRDVTLLEAQPGPGGKLRAVTVEGTAIDAGPTVFTMRDVFHDIFADCGSALEDHLTLRPATVLARHAWGPRPDADRLDLFADPALSEAAIGDFAGAAEARGYRAFRAEARRLFEALDRPFLRSPKADPITLGWRMGAGGLPDYLNLRAYVSMSRALSGYFADARLRQLFGRYATYSGSSPFACPATLMLIAHVEARGVWLIDGGMHRLAQALATLGRSNGVRFRYGTPVREILVERGRAAGVVLADGERLDAGAVICNADPAAIGAGAFGASVRCAVTPTPAHRRSLSALVWTARARASGFPLSRHNVIFSDDYRAEFDALAAGRLAQAPSVYLCAQDRDATDDPPAPPGPERLQIIVNAPANGDGAPLSSAEIDRCTQAMLHSVSRAGLSLDLGDSAKLTTPSDFAAMFPSTGGALYGPASHGWAASFRRQGSRTAIPGLYCASGSTHPGAGVPMAALSARLAVACLLADCRRWDRASTSWFSRTAMPGGISTRAAMTAPTA
ncbi:1-hydroxycarotenoid 3,4-desaturase CrtD [Sphingomonas sp.]|jgi:1-hydroxycarotenoid 3,4-desaturase|uniref:1-hydroxycarotenoid 3,4-desaturase CrtD n=1 Tax=Sphingomonas sp. TaxID=28214 RepID=UPI002D801420|nr:1-hydroxycarotenoid 3,4-desaturase CrtD [Sphingomonas sp.]HEU0045631.1 phytoene desaturase family protein [Sphingomonas sp.]